MTDARKKAEEIVRTYEQSRGSFLRQDKTFILELIEQALDAAGPRVVNDGLVGEAAADYTLKLKRPMMSELTCYIDEAFREGFRAAERMNAIRHLESCFPSTGAVTQWVAEYLAKNGIRPNEAETCAWLRAEVLRRLGGK